MTEYALSAPARADLEGIREYLAPAPRAIQEKLLAGFRDAFRQLADFPGIGRVEPALTLRSVNSVRSIRLASYRIFYHPETNPVIIVAILHGAQDISSILRNRAEASQRPSSERAF